MTTIPSHSPASVEPGQRGTATNPIAPPMYTPMITGFRPTGPTASRRRAASAPRTRSAPPYIRSVRRLGQAEHLASGTAARRGSRRPGRARRRRGPRRGRSSGWSGSREDLPERRRGRCRRRPPPRGPRRVSRTNSRIASAIDDRRDPEDDRRRPPAEGAISAAPDERHDHRADVAAGDVGADREAAPLRRELLGEEAVADRVLRRPADPRHDVDDRERRRSWRPAAWAAKPPPNRIPPAAEEPPPRDHAG